MNIIERQDTDIDEIRKTSAGVTLKVNFEMASKILKEMYQSPLLSHAQACKVEEMRLELEYLVSKVAVAQPR